MMGPAAGSRAASDARGSASCHADRAARRSRFCRARVSTFAAAERRQRRHRGLARLGRRHRMELAAARRLVWQPVGSSPRPAPSPTCRRRGFFRSGLTCRATLSQSARSSSLELRRRGEGGGSGIENDCGRFMDGGCAAARGSADSTGGGALFGRSRARARVAATAVAACRWSSRPLAQPADPLREPSADTAWRSAPTAAHPASAACAPRASGSRLLGTSITKRMLLLSRPAIFPASGPAPK